MTVIFSKKCELGLQAVLFLSTLEMNEVKNAKEISNALKVPKEFVSKVLQTLASNKIVASRKGKHGGFFIKKSVSEIRLIDIVLAIDGLEVFHKCVLGFPDCDPDSPCPVHEEWGKLRDETYRMLSEYSLEDLRDKSIDKIMKLHKDKN